MSYHPLLNRQLLKAKCDDESIDVPTLLSLVSTAYQEKDIDRKRADHANRVMADELNVTLSELALQNMRFRAAMDNMYHGLSLFDEQGRLVVCNSRFLEIYGIDGETSPIGLELPEILGRCDALSRANDLDKRLIIREHICLDRLDRTPIEQQWPDGRWVELTRTSVADGGFLDTIVDITDAHQASDKIAHLARHDHLTDLPNRVLLRERLLEIYRNRRRQQKCAILFLDLDGFKAVNDTLGHAIGDLLLVEVSRRLLSIVREMDVVARLGGDEFAIVMQHIRSRSSPQRFARRVINLLNRPFTIEGYKIHVGASVGIDIIDASEMDADQILRNADIALYQAKADGKNTARLYDPAMHAAVTARRQLEVDLSNAVLFKQFEVFYQPQIDLEAGTVSGFEALARWRHSGRGMISPTEFIPMCEENGLIEELGAQILEVACKDAMAWPACVTVSVNLSPVQFKSGNLPTIVKDVLEKIGFPGSRLELEITESAIFDRSSGIISQLSEIRKLGIRVSLDDFGTGYSSLSHIRSFPFDRIKIDQSFVRELGADAESLAIVRAVVGLCENLGIQSTAEGVETHKQLDVLQHEQCRSVQGYLFSEPVTMSETMKIISEFNTDPPKQISIRRRAA